MDLNYFKNLRILDGGMGQELLRKGLKSKGTLWSTSALLDENFHKLVVDVHLSFINAGADVIVTNNFSSRRMRLIENKVEDKFDYVNKKSCELAVKARDLSKKDVLIAGSLPAQGGTYVVDDRDISEIKKDLNDQAKLIQPYIDFFYLDVFSSGREVEAACEIIEKMNVPVLVGLHIKKNGKLPSGESITEVYKKFKSSNWIGLIGSCVSLEITKKSLNEFKSLDIPYGCKINLWKVEEPMPVNQFNTAKYFQDGKNPNEVLGFRSEVNTNIFKDFSKEIMSEGATILGGCCNVSPNYINALRSLKN